MAENKAKKRKIIWASTYIVLLHFHCAQPQLYWSTNFWKKMWRRAADWQISSGRSRQVQPRRVTDFKNSAQCGTRPSRPASGLREGGRLKTFWPFFLCKGSHLFGKRWSSYQDPSRDTKLAIPWVRLFLHLRLNSFDIGRGSTKDCSDDNGKRTIILPDTYRQVTKKRISFCKRSRRRSTTCRLTVIGFQTVKTNKAILIIS